MKSKYIVIEKDGKEYMIVFPDDRFFSHDRTAESVKRIKSGHGDFWRRELMRSDVISAGFILRGRCYGSSVTLGVDSRPEADTALFLTQIFGG